MKCHAGCRQDDVVAALRDRHLWNGTRPRTEPRRVVATYPFIDESGEVLFEEVREIPKAFRVRRPDGKGGWIWDAHGVRRVLWDLPEVLAVASLGWRIYVVEGPKDATAVKELGLCATTNPFGAGKWQDEFAECLRGAEIVIIADKDAPGRIHSKAVAASCNGRAKTVKVLELPGDQVKDASDFLSAGGTKADLERLADEAPEWGRPRENELAPVLDAVRRFLETYVYFRLSAQSIAVVLWIGHTYLADQIEQSPLLGITSPVMRSGKTRLLDAMELLVRTPWRAVLPSDAVVYRYIEAEHPTFLLDEVDAIFNRKATEYEGLRALLNAGNRQGTTVPRVVGQGTKMTVKKFSVYCPKALAGIGTLPATVADRAIPIRLERRSKREPVAKFRRAAAETDAAPIRSALEAIVPGLPIAEARPAIPEVLDDRAADGWEPLLALADLAGGDWPTLARQAAVELQGNREQDEEALSLVLLRDIRDVLADRERVFSAELLADLHELEASPWGDYFGKPLSSHGLAKLLRPYHIEPGNLRIGSEVKRGYQTSQFSDAFERYLPPLATAADDRYIATEALETGLNTGVRSDVALSEPVAEKGAEASTLFGSDGATS